MIEGLMDGRWRPRFPDLSLGRTMFKRAAVEDIVAEQGVINFQRYRFEK